MSEAAFPKPVAEIMATLADIFRHQEQAEMVELLESAHARFDDVDYNNWNGGTTTWALRLEVPVEIFAPVKPRLADMEKQIADELAYLRRLYPNDPLDEVTVSPITAGDLPAGQRMAPSEIEVRRLWPDGRFRLFLGHVSKYKVLVSKLQAELALRGVSAFVAHEDIEPSLEWQQEIENALRSMHALAALITDDFHASYWTDQEIGWAFGRSVLVLPVRLGADPYGFAGKVQGISGALEQPVALAEALVEALLFNAQTHGTMRRALVSAFCGATSYAMAKTLQEHVVRVPDFTDEEKDALRRACTENSQVRDAFHVPAAIDRAFGRAQTAERAEVNDIPF